MPDPTQVSRRQVLKKMRRLAFRHPWSGKELVNPRHKWDTTAITEPGRPARILYTWETGYHASGWWRNSDYDSCFHISLSHPHSPVEGEAPITVEAPSDEEVRAWARAAFPDHFRWVWIEPPAGVLDPYRNPNVAHIRLFTDRQANPVLPKGEVYHLKPYDDGSSPEKIFR